MYNFLIIIPNIYSQCMTTFLTELDNPNNEILKLLLVLNCSKIVSGNISFTKLPKYSLCTALLDDDTISLVKEI